MNNYCQELRKTLYGPKSRHAKRRAWTTWGIETLSCLAIGALLGLMYGRAF